jgi:hypothetical protein
VSKVSWGARPPLMSPFVAILLDIPKVRMYLRFMEEPCASRESYAERFGGANQLWARTFSPRPPREGELGVPFAPPCSTTFIAVKRWAKGKF